jgi:hypothetical protein
LAAEPNQTRLLQHQQIDLVDGNRSQFVQTNVRRIGLGQRNKAALRQATMHRHLTALEANLVEAARTGFLTFVATATVLPKPEPMPRPTRLRLSFLAPSAGLIVFSSI